jgi:acyl-CoA oxidase
LPPARTFDRVVLEAFVAGIAACEDADVARVLTRVFDLHALATIETDRAAFLKHGRLTARRSKAITAAVNDVCGELRPPALLLVETFGVPEEAIAAGIDWVDARPG